MLYQTEEVAECEVKALNLNYCMFQHSSISHELWRVIKKIDVADTSKQKLVFFVQAGLNRQCIQCFPQIDSFSVGGYEEYID